MKLGDWLGFLMLVVAIFVLWQIRQLLLLVFTAVVIATALNSLVRQVRRLGLQRNQAIPLTLAGAALVMILFFIIIVPPFVSQFERLIELLPSGFAQILSFLSGFRNQLPDWAPNLPDLPSLFPRLVPSVQGVVRNFYSFFSDSVSVVLSLLLVLVLSVMLLINPTAYRHTFLLLFPSFYRRRADQILSICEVDLGNWLAGILTSSVFIFALSALGLWALGIPLVLAHALLAGLLNFIPNIGPTLSVVFPVTIALLEEPWKAIAVFIFYIVIQQIESYWLTPTIMAKQVSLLPALTLVAQIFFATAFGLFGLILALPLAVVAKVWLQEVIVQDILDQWNLPLLEQSHCKPTAIQQPEVIEPSDSPA
ncbi:MAG: AI-2E family transporter [Thainema sp.]